jgi:hypothetical protein
MRLIREDRMKDRIGITAGKIWESLKKGDSVSLSQVPKLIKEKEALTYQALGWLARENKIEYDTKGKRTTVRAIK